MSRTLDLGCPLDPDYPGNAGLVAAWAAVPEFAAGLTLFDLLNTGKGNPNHGTLTNGPTWTGGTGKFGAVSFDGVNDYVATAYTPTTGATAISIGVVFKSTGATAAQYLANTTYNGSVAISLCIGGNGTVEGFSFFNGGWNSSGIGGVDLRGDGLWHSAVGTYGGSTLRYYTDGFVRATNTGAAASLPGPASVLDLGRYGYDGAYFPGLIETVRVWDRALSAAEVADVNQQSRREWGYSEQYRWLEDRTWFLPPPAAAVTPSVFFPAFAW